MEEKQIKQTAINKIIDFAKLQTSKIWHQMVMDWNWDNYEQFLDWIVENPNSDKATILMIYWKSISDVKFSQRNLIEDKYLGGFYKQQIFSFDPENDEGDNWVSYVVAEIKTTIPLEMINKLEGENVPYPENFIEGMPAGLFYEIEELYE